MADQAHSATAQPLGRTVLVLTAASSKIPGLQGQETLANRAAIEAALEPRQAHRGKHIMNFSRELEQPSRPTARRGAASAA
jgi:hypothetical protein